MRITAPSVIVTASFPTPTDTGVDGAMDVDVDVEIGDKTYNGGVTLIKDHHGDWSSWGCRDNWMDQPLLDAMDSVEDPDDLSAEIVHAAAAEIVAA